MRAAHRLEQLLMDSGVGKRQVRGAIAKICGISPQAVHQWFDSTNPTAENLEAVTSFYGGNLVWVITGKGEMRSSAPKDVMEVEVLELWRRLPEESKEVVRSQLAEIGRELQPQS